MSNQPRWRKTMPALAVLLFAGTAGGGIVYFIKSMLDTQPGPVKQVVQEVKIIRPPPPPPETEPPPPPPDVQEKVDIPEPEPTPELADAPPAEQLGIDAEGGAGGDGFGLLARKGGRDLLATGGSAFAWYTGLLKNEILERLQNDKRVRSSSYKVTVRIWLKPDGSVEKVKLAGSTGDRELDSTIELALARLERLPQAPPLEMPQPVSLQIVSRI